jgi:hypothetical protein
MSTPPRKNIVTHLVIFFIHRRLIAVYLVRWCVTCVSAIYPLVAFYDIHGGKREMLLFCFGPGHLKKKKIHILIKLKLKFCDTPHSS